MKHLLLSALLISSFAAKANADFICKDVYDAKIAKMEKNQVLRKVVKVGIAGVVGLTTGMAVMASTGALLPLGVVVYGTFTGVGFSLLPYWGVDSIDREYGIRDAYEVQQLLLVSEAELIDAIKAEREELIKKLIAEFEARISHAEYLNRLVFETNHDRLQLGLPALSADEVVKFQKEKIALEVRGEKLQIINGITESLKLAKKKGAVSQEMTYDGWRGILFSNQEVFCTEGKAKTTRRATLDLIKNIVNDDLATCDFE